VISDPKPIRLIKAHGTKKYINPILKVVVADITFSHLIPNYCILILRPLPKVFQEEPHYCRASLAGAKSNSNELYLSYQLASEYASVASRQP
jgi:hypothetical protein